MKPALPQNRKPCRLLATASALMFATVGAAQDSQFRFDETGNLTVQTTAAIAPPQILAQPQTEVVSPGALASFFVVAANTHNLTYQWQFNGTDISGATGDALLLQNVSALDQGQYSVVLVNSSGSITSAPAALMLDGDRDGLPDSWEQTYFGSLGQKPTGDFDGDGVSNREEFLQGTNPADSASVMFRLTVISDGGHVAMNPGRFTFTNGEVVTLTAIALPSGTFHGWRGATNTATEKTITLTMDGNKTVYAYLGNYDITWTNTASGDWNVASNWSPDFVPGTNDNVFISSGATVTLNSNTACGSLTLSAGTLAGSGALTLHRHSFWSGGTMSSSGRTIIAPGGTLTINGGFMGLTGGRILENGGTMYWNAGTLQAATATVITNRAGALFQVQSAAAIIPGAAGGRFDNAGTFRKTSAGTTTFNDLVSFNNYGTAELQSGILLLVGGGVNTGTMDINTGTTLNLSGGIFTSSGGSSITGAGNFTMSGAVANLAGLVNLSGNHTFTFGAANLTGNYICTNNTMTISGVTANFSGTGLVSPAVLNLSGASLGGSQLVTVLSQMNWTGGTMTGVGRTVIPPGVTLTINGGFMALTGGRILENGGTMYWNAGTLQAATATVITNRVGALFQVQSAAAITPGAGGGRFDNAGTFRKTSAGTTTFNDLVSFNNYGTVELQSGILLLVGGGVNTGTMDINTGTTLNLSGGTFTSSGGSSITGAGNFTMSGAVANLAGLVNLSGNHTFTFGAANLTGNYICTNNTMTISGVTANFSGTGLVSPAVLNLSGGSLGGSQLVTVLSQMNWTGGSMTGVGRTIIPPGVTLTINGGFMALSGGRILENGGTTFWNAGTLQAATATVITNRAGALFQVQSAAAILPGAGGGRFDNAGTFRKTSAGTTTLNDLVTFNNYGTVELQSGILAANGGYTSTTNALLQCAIGGTTVGTGYGRLQVAGAVTLNGALGVALTNGFVPATNDTFTVLTAGTRNGTFANFYFPSNAATMQMSNTANSVIVNVSAVLAVPPPLLHIEKITTVTARLYWPTNYPEYHLEYNAKLGTTNWAASGLTPVITGTNFVVTNSLFSAQRYYRLSRVPALYTPPPPSLTIQRVTSSTVRLLWPAEDDRAFTLQSNTNLTTTNWVTVSPVAAILGWNYAVTNPISGVQKFYRLINP